MTLAKLVKKKKNRFYIEENFIYQLKILKNIEYYVEIIDNLVYNHNNEVYTIDDISYDLHELKCWLDQRLHIQIPNQVL